MPGSTMRSGSRALDSSVLTRPSTNCEPDRARYAYVCAVALHSGGRTANAITVLEESLARHPSDRDTLMALVSFHREVKDIDSALKYAEQLAPIIPEDKDLARLIDDLKRQGNRPADH